MKEMSPEHLALLYSIQHWKKNLEAELPSQVRISPEDCALCQLFYNNDCEGCPVMEATGHELCTGTPYDQVFELRYSWLKLTFDTELSRRAKAAFRAGARAEINFLESLLPGSKS